MRKVNPKKGITLPVLILSIYNEYISFGYPQDRNVYVIRCNTETYNRLSDLGKDIIEVGSDKVTNDPLVFMGFRIMINEQAHPNVIEFGPEPEFINWSK